MLGCLLRLHAMANCTSLPRSPCLLGCLPDSSLVSSPPHYQGQAQACRGENEELPRYLRGMEALGEQTPSILGFLQRAPGEASSGGESNRWRGPDPDSSILSVPTQSSRRWYGVATFAQSCRGKDFWELQER